MNTAPVSVVIPAYGHAAFIGDAIRSVLAQNPPPHEVIVVNDDSPDDTAAVLATFIESGQIRYVHQANAGMARARNHGAELATGEFVYFLDDDDLMFPGAMSWMVTELTQHPACGMVYGDAVLFSGVPPQVVDQDVPAQPVDLIPFMLFNQLGSPGQVLMRRSALIDVGMFDPSIWGTDDWDLWMRMLHTYPARFAARPVLAYRQHAANASRNVARMYQSSRRVARRYLRTFPVEHRAILRRYSYLRLRRYHAPRLERMAVQSIRSGEWLTALAATRAWAVSWGAEALAYVRLKLFLLRLGRWHMIKDEPLSRTILQHCGRL